jgi:hypothetical protein
MSAMPEPFTPTEESMAQVQEFFSSLLVGGFTESQACQIIGVMLAHLALGRAS